MNELANPLIATAIGIMGLSIALAYMLSKFTNKGEWEAWAKVELYELIWSVILVITIWGAVSLLNAFAQAWVGTNPLNYTAAKLEKIAVYEIMPSYVTLLILDHQINLMHAWTSRFGPAAWGLKVKRWPGVDVFNQPVKILEFAYLVAFSSLSIQRIALEVIDILAFNFLLPAGLLLRFFPPTRSAGNLLIGIAISFYIIFPLVYSLSFQALDEIKKSHGWQYSRLRGGGIPLAFTLYGVISPMLFFFVPPLFTTFLNHYAHLAVEVLVIPSLAMMISITTSSAIAKVLEWKTIGLGGWR